MSSDPSFLPTSPSMACRRGCLYSAPIHLFCEHFYVNSENVDARCLPLCLQVPFQARSPLLRDFMVQKIAALPSQADILTPAVWKHLLALCSTEQHGWTGLQLSAALVLRYAVTGLRYKHTKRTVFSPELSSSRAFVWKVTKGKDGQPFAVSLPSHVAPKWPLFQHLHYELRNWLGERAAFMPDCFFAHDGTVCLDERPSPYHRFQAFFRSLLTLQPLALSEVDAASFSTYSMRRLLLSVADCLQLSDVPWQLAGWSSFAIGSPLQCGAPGVA